VLCVFISTSPPRKMVFRVKVEEYASFVLRGSEEIVLGVRENQSAPDLSVHAWMTLSQEVPALPLDCGSGVEIQVAGGVASCPQVYAAGSHLAMPLSVVVNIYDGVIQGFAWDNNCAACGPQHCMESSASLNLTNGMAGTETLPQGVCGRTLSQCAPKGLACDLQILVTWAGTDRNGRNARSAGMRLSRFTGATIRSIYDTMDYNYDEMSR